MRPTILVGIGSGGLRSVEAAWKLSQEISNPDNRPLVEYIYLETDRANKPISSDIVLSPLALTDVNSTVHAIRTDISSTSQWLNGMSFPNNILSGAGGSPVAGRLTLWDQNNRNIFKKKLQDAQGRLSNKSLQIPLVYVVGSFGGGTGSGTFLDIAYMIRDAFAGKVELHGLFMIPNRDLNDQVVYSNSVCCLKELDYYSSSENAFPFKWSANPPRGHEAQNRPYDLVQIISAAYGSSSFGPQPGVTLPPVSYSRLHEEAGIFLYLNALGLYDTRLRSLKDATDGFVIAKYTTYGLAAIHYPENDIKEIEANELACALLRRIGDSSNYYDPNRLEFCNISQSDADIRNKVRLTFDRSFVKILEDWCSQISVVDNNQALPMESHLQSLAHYLSISKDSYQEKRNHVYRLFKAGGEYYKQLKALCSVNATDRVVNLIIDETKETLNTYHNLNVAEIALDEIEVSVKSILNFWNANGYTALPIDWDNRLKKDLVELVMPMPGMYTLLVEKEKVYFDRLKYVLLYGLAMHIFSDQIDTIYKGLQGAQNAQGNTIVIQTTQGEKMPTRLVIREWKSIVDNVADGSDSNYSSCSQVSAQLKAKLGARNNGNIWYIYPKQDLPHTLQEVDGMFKSTNGQERHIKEVFGNDDLFGFLMRIEPNDGLRKNNSEKDLYDKVVTAYFGKVTLGEPFSVSTAIGTGAFNEIIKMAALRSYIPHVPINPDGRNAVFKEHDKIPHVLIGYDGAGGTVLDGISKTLEQIDINGYSIGNADRDKFSHIGLNNWLIFYQEFGHMSDKESFSIINDLEDFNSYVQCYMTDSQNSKLKEEDYHGMRMPYISYENSKEVSISFINKAIKLENQNEFEEAIKAYSYASYWNMHNPIAVTNQAALLSKIKQETPDDRFDRYYTIGSRYMAQQDYPNARAYYDRAQKIKEKDNNVITQLTQLDEIEKDVIKLVNQGDQLCTTANTLYDQCVIRHDVAKRPDCMEAYKRILEIYNQAQELSKYDKRVKDKILNIERRIQSIV